MSEETDPLASEEDPPEEDPEEEETPPAAEAKPAAPKPKPKPSPEVVSVPVELWDKLTKVVEGSSGRSLTDAIDEVLDSKAHKEQHEQLDALIAERESTRKEPGMLAKLFGLAGN